jgi:quercetin dioxygenase-like cupin family protein
VSVREATEGYVRPAGEGRPVWFLDALLTWKATAGSTNGQFELVEQHGRHGFGPPVHLHEGEAEAFYVLDGEMTFVLGQDRLRAAAGAFVFVPAGVKHAFVVESAEARFLALAMPPGKLEAFLDEFGQPATEAVLPAPLAGPPDFAAFDAAAARHGQQVVGPPPLPSSTAG